MPEISVIVPVYKVEPYIHRCVDSILAQTFTDFELILVDDGSPDACGTICDEYAHKDERVRIFHQNNRGVSAARNLALRNARGNKIMFCDGDDFVSPHWIEQLYRVDKEFPNSMCVCEFVRFQSEDEIPALSQPPEKTVKELSYYQLYSAGLSAYVWNKIFDYETLKAYSILFDESVTLSEDVAFNVQYYQICCDRAVLINQPLYYYRNTEDSASVKYRPNSFEEHLLPFSCRLPLIGQDDLNRYCDKWFFLFCELLENTFNKRNATMSFREKMQYNQKMVQKEEFQYCLDHATLANENTQLVSALKNGNYFMYWIILCVSKLKHRLVG